MDTRQKSEIAFKEFLELIQKLTSHDKDLHRKLQKSYDQTNPHFRWSRGFINLVSQCSEKVRHTPEKRLLHVKEFISELSNYKAKPLKHLISNASCVSDSDEDSPTEDAPVSPTLGTTESPKAVNVIEMEVDEKRSEGHIAGGSDDDVDCRGRKRKKSDVREEEEETEEEPFTGNQNEAECRKKKRMFYNSTSLAGLMTTSYPRMGYLKKPRTDTSSDVAATDIICLDDDDDDNNDDDNNDVEGGLSSDFDKSLGANCHHGNGDNLSTADSGLIPSSSIVTFKPRPVLSKRSSLSDHNALGVNHLHTNTDGGKAPVEVICLDDDDDDDDVGDNEKVGRSQPLAIGSVRRPITTPSLAITTIDDDVIEITDADENHDQEKLLPAFGRREEESSLKTTEVPEIHSNTTLCINGSDNNANVEVIETMVVKRKAGDAVEDRMVEEVRQSNKRETLLLLLLNNEEEEELDSYPNHHHHQANEEKKSLKRWIKHLEHQLLKLSTEIRRLQQTELTLDDLNSDTSDYIKTDRLERKFLKVWRKLCRILHCPTYTDCQMTEKQFSVQISGYPHIGKEVSDFINKDRVFPDYQDIYDIVVSSNDKYRLLLTDAAVGCLSEKIFTHIGNRLQQLRKTDLSEEMKTYLPDIVRSYDDPAIYDQDLIEKLEESQAVGRKCLEQVLKSFSEKQDIKGDTMVDEVHNEDNGNEGGADEDDSEDNSEDDSEDDSEDEAANSIQGVVMHDLDHFSDVEPSSEAEDYSDLELSKSMFETDEDHGTDEDDERCPQKEIIFISFDDGSSKADENTTTRRCVTEGSLENDCKEEAEEETHPPPPPISIDADRSLIIIDEKHEVSHNSEETTNCVASNEQHILKSSHLKIRSELLDNIRRLTSSISFNGATSLSESGNETSIEEETNETEEEEEAGLNCSHATHSDDIRVQMMDDEGSDAVVLHSQTIDGHLCELRGEEKISDHGRSGSKEEEELKDLTNNELMETSTAHQKVSGEETVMWKEDDMEKTMREKADVDIVYRKDVNLSEDSVTETSDATAAAAVVSFSSSCVSEMAASESGAKEASTYGLVETTTPVINDALMSDGLQIPLLEELLETGSSASKDERERAAETEPRPVVILPLTDQQVVDAFSSQEAAAEPEISDTSCTAAEPTVIASAAAEEPVTCGATSDKPLPLSMNDDALTRSNDEDDESDFPADLFHRGCNGALDDMVQSQCGSSSCKSKAEDLLLPDDISSTSDLDLRLDTSSDSPDLSRSSSALELKKSGLEEVLEKQQQQPNGLERQQQQQPKGLLEVLREASKRELLDEGVSSLNLCKDSNNQLEIEMEEEEGFCREQQQQLHLSSERTSSPVSEQMLHSSQDTELLLFPDKQSSCEPPISGELDAGERQCGDKTMCKDEDNSMPVAIISPAPFGDHCEGNVLPVDQNINPPLSTRSRVQQQSEDAMSQSKDNILIQLDSDLEDIYSL